MAGVDEELTREECGRVFLGVEEPKEATNYGCK
jgi:hypothetical protein